MSKINCDTAQDLMPLYVDDVLSPSSRELVEEHLAGCENCAARLEQLKTETVVSTFEDVKPMKKFKRHMLTHRIITGVLIGLCVMVLAVIFVNMFEYNYTYEQVGKDIKVISDSDGHVHIIYDGDKVLFTKWEIVFTGVRQGKAQYTLHFYENLNFQDLAMYYGSRSPWMARTYHEEGRPFEVACICPNDKAFGAVCEICGNDERYVENTTFQSRYGYVKGPNFDYDQPNPKASEPFEDEYLTMEMEISEVVYWQFDQNSYLDVYLDMLTGHSHFRKYTVWKRY